MVSTPLLPASAEAAPIPTSEIALTGHMAAVGDAGDWLATWLEPREASAELVFAMRLCLEEALANIVMHGGLEPEGAIVASLAEEAGGVVLRISDEGRPFDPVTAELPHDQEIGGNGLILIRRYASVMSYRREGGRNHLTLSFSRLAETPAPGR